MPDESKREPGKGARADVEDLKARLGLKVARRAPSVAPAPPPAPEPKQAAAEEATAVTAQPSVAVPPARPAPQPVPPPRPAPRAYDPSAYAFQEPVEEIPKKKTFWERWGRSGLYMLAPALAGIILGYIFSKGSARGAGLAQVKADAGKILGLVSQAYGTVEQVAALVDPAYGKALAEKKEPPPVQALLRRQVDWAAIGALDKVSAPRELEQIFETDYKRFTRVTVKMLTGFFVDFSRLMQLVRLHVERSKQAQLLLDNEAKAGVGPRPYGVVVQSLPDLQPGEIVLLRGQRMVKKGKEEVPVFDIARRGDPGKPIAVPGTAVVPIQAAGLFKDSGSLLDEFNRRVRDLVDVLRRLLDTRPALTGAIEKIAAMKV